MLANRFETKNEEKNDDGREKSEVNGNFENDKNHHIPITRKVLHSTD